MCTQHTKLMGWNTMTGLQTPLYEDQQLIVIQAGNENGFVVSVELTIHYGQ